MKTAGIFKKLTALTLVGMLVCGSAQAVTATAEEQPAVEVLRTITTTAGISELPAATEGYHWVLTGQTTVKDQNQCTHQHDSSCTGTKQMTNWFLECIDFAYLDFSYSSVSVTGTSDECSEYMAAHPAPQGYRWTKGSLIYVTYCTHECDENCGGLVVQYTYQEEKDAVVDTPNNDGDGDNDGSGSDNGGSDTDAPNNGGDNDGNGNDNGGSDTDAPNNGGDNDGNGNDNGGSDTDAPNNGNDNDGSGSDTPDNSGNNGGSNTVTPDNGGSNTDTPDNGNNGGSNTVTPDNGNNGGSDTDTPDNSGNNGGNDNSGSDIDTPDNGDNNDGNDSIDVPDNGGNDTDTPDNNGGDNSNDGNNDNDDADTTVNVPNAQPATNPVAAPTIIPAAQNVPLAVGANNIGRAVNDGDDVDAGVTDEEEPIEDQVQIDDEETPLAASTISDEAVPLAAAEDNCIIHWIILLLTLLAGGYHLVRIFFRGRQSDEEEAGQEA